MVCAKSRRRSSEIGDGSVTKMASGRNATLEDDENIDGDKQGTADR